MNDLTIDDIHRIRKEHAVATHNMSFDEYKADMRKEVKPLLDLLKLMKIEQKKTTPSFKQPVKISKTRNLHSDKSGVYC